MDELIRRELIKGGFSPEQVESISDRWFSLVLGVNEQVDSQEAPENFEVLEELRPVFASMNDLDRSASWARILEAERSLYDDPIVGALEDGLEWDEVLATSWENDRIRRAFRCGASPDSSVEQINEIEQQVNWEMQVALDDMKERARMRASRYYHIPLSEITDEDVRRLRKELE